MRRPSRQAAAKSFEAGQQLVDVGLVHRHCRVLRTVQQGGIGRRASARLRRAFPAFLPNAATICATLASIVFSVPTTLVMRWPVMSWKLHAS